jgi:hypothetical protein
MLFAAVLVIGTAVAGFGWLKLRHQRKGAQAK